MTKVRSWGLVAWGAWAALIVTVMVARPELPAEVLTRSLPFYTSVWGPLLVAGLAAWGLVRWFGHRDALDARIAAALEGHPIRRELGYLLMFLSGFVLSMMALSWISSLYAAETDMDLRMSVSLVCRLLFLFTLPMLVMDRSGVTVDGRGTAMPSLALGVREPWRWLGLVPVGVAVGLVGNQLAPVYGLPPLTLGVVGFLLAFALVCMCEEIFYRGMLQTRLEFILGRWAGIVVASTVFASTYAVIQPYDAVVQMRGHDFVQDLWLSLLSYGAGGLLYGYLWTCFRNIWITVVLRLSLLVIVLPPGLGPFID
ncbi:lysostaphin resistance A-like protein [Nocardiopsis sp. NPDC050513]|uniref:lysostaphin resistance A-like protein n=1 Tax=Nocardiopsis sp. NPDC050513 TaxID=3364338 RepID=UPI003797F42B